MLVKFFSCVPGRIVSRFGTGTLIGAVHTPDGVQFNETDVVGISSVEWARYWPSYERHLRAGDLVERTLADFEAQNAPPPKPAPTGAEDAPSDEPTTTTEG